MKSFLKWLQQMLSPGDTPDDPYRYRPKARISPAQRRKKRLKPVKKATNPQKPEVFDYESEGPGRIADGGPGKNVLMQNRYIREDTGTHETLKIVDDSILDSDDEPEAFDPYNTGRFDRSKSWDSPSRKK